MPNPYQDLLTYWNYTGQNGRGGSTFANGASYYGRWEDRTEQFRTPGGDISVSRAIIYLPSNLETVFLIGGYIYKGVSLETDPLAVTEGCFPIRGKVLIPDLRRVRQELRLLL